jgi:hypothetical protein
MFNTVLELLAVFPMFVAIVKAPQPPERLDRTIISYQISCVDEDGSKYSESNKKLEENTRHENSAELVADLPDEIEAPVKKTIYTMTESELNALSLKQKAKLLHMNKNTFKTFVKLVNREAGPKMQDKILVAAVVWNRKYCKQYPDTIKKVMYQGGQFTMRGQKKTEIHGNANDKKAQLAILLAYRMVHNNEIPHNVMNFNSISYRQGSPSRFKKYKHYNNYFLKDTRCHCKWCSECS